ncbi:MAG: 23S rRNA (guanosine(2251)-2'-O)-methyltransferase RlmB [Deltaproteobacteria bacterium]|nr:23S rRNA (guanosine(2251)-2'-O)-methyltransferase RlmB [Deltaproteobacteria bacterium]
MSRIIYGINPVIEAITSHPQDFKEVIIFSGKTGREVDNIKNLASKNRIRFRIGGQQEFDRLAKGETHQGIIAILNEFRYAALEDIFQKWKTSNSKAFILILDSIEDPQNLGSLIRTANSAGVHGVIIPKDRASSVTPTVVKASAGATERTMISQVTNIAQTIETLKKQGIWVVGIEGDARESIYKSDFNIDIAIVIGSEGKGIRRLVKEKCDSLASIPMKGQVSSLNAGIAGAIAMFEVLRQRGFIDRLERQR